MSRAPRMPVAGYVLSMRFRVTSWARQQGDFRPGDVANRFGIRLGAAHKLLSRLVLDGLLVRVGYGTYRAKRGAA